MSIVQFYNKYINFFVHHDDYPGASGYLRQKKDENRKVLISDNVFNVPFSDDKS